MMSSAELVIPRLEMINERGSLLPQSMLLEDVRNDPTQSAEAAIELHQDHTRRGDIPGFIISAKLIDTLVGASFMAAVDATSSRFTYFKDTGLSSGDDLGEDIALDCFRTIDEVFGVAEHGRALQHFNRLAVNKETAAGREGDVHTDSMNGLTVHVQRYVIARRSRQLTMGLRRSTEPAGDRLGFDSVEAGITEPKIWRGNVRQGDITVLNSGLFLPNGDYLESVHQFRTVYPKAKPGQITASFSQFVENSPKV